MKYYAYSNFFDCECEIRGRTNYGRLIYLDGLGELAKLLKARAASKHQNVVVITGETGSGKSMAGLRLIKDMEPLWSVSKGMIYTEEDLKAKIRNRGRRGESRIVMLDEGSIILNSADHARKEVTDITKIFDTMRSLLGWTWVICIPSLSFLNNRIRNFHIDFLIRCPSRAPVYGYDPRGFCNIYTHQANDWGKPYFQLQAVTTFEMAAPRAVAQYERIKELHQTIYLNEYTSEANA